MCIVAKLVDSVTKITTQDLQSESQKCPEVLSYISWGIKPTSQLTSDVGIRCEWHGEIEHTRMYPSLVSLCVCSFSHPLHRSTQNIAKLLSKLFVGLVSIHAPRDAEDALSVPDPAERVVPEAEVSDATTKIVV